MDRPESLAVNGSDQGAAADYSLADWLAQGKPAGVPVEVAGEDDLAGHYTELLGAPRITVTFAAFTDGRGFSHARKLREKGFDGELLASGELLADQWQYLQRCGFDGLLDPALSDKAHSLQRFSDGYQADARQSRPLFRRRLGA